MATAVTIRLLEVHEWRLLRALRLAALRDAPDAFGPTFEAAEAEPDSVWRRYARGFASDAPALLVAERDGRGVGLVSAARVGTTGRIGAMWVDPAERGAGLARRLLAAACDLLCARGCERLELGVTETNAAAIALYEQFGFARTGEAHPLREGSPLRELEMARPCPVRAGDA